MESDGKPVLWRTQALKTSRRPPATEVSAERHDQSWIGFEGGDGGRGLPTRSRRATTLWTNGRAQDITSSSRNRAFQRRRLVPATELCLASEAAPRESRSRWAASTMKLPVVDAALMRPPAAKELDEHEPRRWDHRVESANRESGGFGVPSGTWLLDAWSSFAVGLPWG